MEDRGEDGLEGVSGWVSGGGRMYWRRGEGEGGGGRGGSYVRVKV